MSETVLAAWENAFQFVVFSHHRWPSRVHSCHSLPSEEVDWKHNVNTIEVKYKIFSVGRWSLLAKTVKRNNFLPVSRMLKLSSCRAVEKSWKWHRNEMLYWPDHRIRDPSVPHYMPKSQKPNHTCSQGTFLSFLFFAFYSLSSVERMIYQEKPVKPQLGTLN